MLAHVTNSDLPLIWGAIGASIAATAAAVGLVRRKLSRDGSE